MKINFRNQNFQKIHILCDAMKSMQCNEKRFTKSRMLSTYATYNYIYRYETNNATVISRFKTTYSVRYRIGTGRQYIKIIMIIVIIMVIIICASVGVDIRPEYVRGSTSYLPLTHYNPATDEFQRPCLNNELPSFYRSTS